MARKKSTSTTSEVIEETTVVEESVAEGNDAEIEEVGVKELEDVADSGVEEKKSTSDTRTEKKKKTYEPSDGIACRSITQGMLFMDGEKTNITYSWSDYGDVTDVEYRDLVAAIHSKSSYIYNPFIIIDDEDFIAEFPQLDKFYSDRYSMRDLKAILFLDVNKMVAEISNLPSGAKNSLKTIASTCIREGEIDSVRKIKAIDEVFGTQLFILAD